MIKFCQMTVWIYSLYPHISFLVYILHPTSNPQQPCPTHRIHLVVVHRLDNVLLQEVQERFRISSTIRLGSFGGGSRRSRGSSGNGRFNRVVSRELSCKVGGEGRCFGCRREGEGLDSTDVGVLGCRGGFVGLDFAKVEVLDEVFEERKVREVFQSFWSSGNAYPCERQRRRRTRVGRQSELVGPIQ